MTRPRTAASGPGWIGSQVLRATAGPAPTAVGVDARRALFRRIGAIAAGTVAVGVPLTGWIGARVLTDAPRWRAPRRTLRATFYGPSNPAEARIMKGEVHLEGEGADIPGTWGLVFDGGYAQIIDPTDWGVDGTSVVRPYRPLEGVVPTALTQVDRRRSRGRHDDETDDDVGTDRRRDRNVGPWPVRSALSAYAWPDDPQLLAQQHGATFQIDAVPSLTGHLPAWRFTPPRRSTVTDMRRVWVIGVHGRGARRTELFRIVHTALEAGATALVTSYRTDAWTAAPARVTTLGQEEWADVDAAVRLAIEQGARRIVLAGCSLGGAISAQVLRHSTVADRIDGVILDSPALHWPPILQHVAERRHLPRPLIPLVMATAKVRAKLDWDALDHLSTSDTLAHPILLFHGTEDPTVPVWLSDALAAARPDLVTYIRVPGAGHVRSWNTARRRYERAVTDFLTAVAEAEPPPASKRRTPFRHLAPGTGVRAPRGASPARSAP